MNSEKSEVRRQKSEGGWAALLTALAVMAWGTVALATPTQEEVFRSISTNVGESAETGKVLGVLMGASAIAVTIIALTQRKRQKAKRALNSPKKLVKEVLRQMDLPGREMRKYKAIAEQGGYSSPLVVMLCPSLARGEKDEKGK